MPTSTTMTTTTTLYVCPYASLSVPAGVACTQALSILLGNMHRSLGSGQPETRAGYFCSRTVQGLAPPTGDPASATITLVYTCTTPTLPPPPPPCNCLRNMKKKCRVVGRFNHRIILFSSVFFLLRSFATFGSFVFFFLVHIVPVTTPPSSNSR